MARRAHRSSILSSSRTPDQPRVARSEHLVHFSRRRCFEHNQRPEHLTCRRPRLDVARRAHPWPGTWCTYRRAQYERYSLAVTSDGKVGPSGVVLRPLSGPGGDNVKAVSTFSSHRPPGPCDRSRRRARSSSPQLFESSVRILCLHTVYLDEDPCVPGADGAAVHCWRTASSPQERQERQDGYVIARLKSGHSSGSSSSS